MTELDPVIIVIFGITGDLAQRKLLPALYRLFKNDVLSDDTVIIGVSRRDVSADEVLAKIEHDVREIDNDYDPTALDRLQQALRMQQMSLTDGAEYDELRNLLTAIETEKKVCMHRLYYLSIPPQMFGPIVRNLGQHGLNDSCDHGTASSRLLVEKPFGYDSPSAEALIKETGEWFGEEQLFRIDHYVAKQTVQDILIFRQSNPLIDKIWDGRHIAQVEVTAYEQIGIEGRAAFYDSVGALRDFVQNHLLQVLAIVTMELPSAATSTALHAAKLTLLRAITPLAGDQILSHAVRGQYDGYRTEVDNPDTTTETYASLTLTINNDRWQGVPMTIRTGKAMARKLTEVRITFRNEQGTTDSATQLVFDIQDNGSISLQSTDEKKDYTNQLQQVIDDFESSTKPAPLDAYSRVLIDTARGDHTLFTTANEVLAAWGIVDTVLQSWSSTGDGLVIYPQGSGSVGQQ